jgi:hypothetical protein
MMPTMAALINQPETRSIFAGENVAAMAFAERAGVAAPAAAAVIQHTGGPRPLSDGLGHFRILRTSPLASIAATCCADC